MRVWLVAEERAAEERAAVPDVVVHVRSLRACATHTHTDKEHKHAD